MVAPRADSTDVRRLELMLDHVPTLISYVDKDLRYRYNNRAYEQWFGHDRRDIIGKPLVDVLGEEAYARLHPYFERALAGETVQFDSLVPYRDGGTRYINATYTPDIDPRGNVAGFIVSVADITQRRAAESALAAARDLLEARVHERTRELEESRRKAERYAQVSPDLIAMANMEGYFTSVNPAFTNILGWTEEEMISRPYAEFVHPEDVEATTDQVARLSGGERVMGFHNRYRTASGEYRSIEWNATVDADRTTIYAVGRDATDRRRLEKEAHLTAVARPLVRRLLLSQGGMTPVARRGLGNALALDADASDLEGLLAAYRATGGGVLTLKTCVGSRYTFTGHRMLELQRGSATPTCHLALGYLEGAVRHATGRAALGSEIRCESQGHEACEFIVMARTA